MNRLQTETVSRIIGPTMCIVDQQKCKAALAYGRAVNCEPEVRRMIISARLRWLTWHTLAQRKWQAHTKNPNKARHHDSISLREKYVRCHQ